MIDTFIVTLHVPAEDSLFRQAVMTIQTPTGSVETRQLEKWRDLDNEVTIRNYVEARLINAFPARRMLWHGSITEYYSEGAGVVAVISVQSDHFDAVEAFRA